MNAAHLHIILVHLPIVLVPTATLLLAFALLRKQGTVATVALVLFVGSSLGAIPAFLIAEEAEEIVEHLPGVSQDTIEEHEEAADVAFWLTLFVGGGSAGALLIRKRAPRLAQATLKALVVAGAVSSGTLAYTAYEGGKIRHPEAYDTAASSAHDDQEAPDHE
jgi:uncharacterized membrane protein YebE (DUF533 family)